MGMNFYAVTPATASGDDAIEVHIGKSSAGWCFSLAVYPELGINSLDDWKDYLVGRKIYTEEAEQISFNSMIAKITERNIKGAILPRIFTPEFLIQNFAETGPNGLLRHEVHGHCVGQGKGTYDYIQGEFS